MVRFDACVRIAASLALFGILAAAPAVAAPARKAPRAGASPTTNEQFPTEVVAPIATPSLATVEAIGLPFSGASTATPFQRTIRKVGGSGFVVSAEGHVVTSPHTVQDAKFVNVTIEDVKYEAKVITTDEFYELTLLKVDDPKAAGKRFTPVRWGKSRDMVVGNPVVVMGSPATLDKTITYGFVTNIRDIRLRGTRGLSTGVLVPDALEMDAAIVPSNYGGPVFNGNGEVIGVVNRYTGPESGQANMNYMVPSDAIKPIVDQLLTKGRAFHPWFGIEPYAPYGGSKNLAVYLGVPIREINPDTGEPYGIVGVLVNSVAVGSPAYDAGIQRGDLILKINGRIIKDTKDLELTILSMKQNQSFTCTIVRARQVYTKRITIADRPTLKEQQERDIRIQRFGI
ncbi:MAG TPA: trypsin-like peptidase domain-containing protein [bacterium]|nr:trypsin-like peptidase domain-containing protein [bacterium]